MSLELAGEGRSLFLTKEQMGCKLGTVFLGFEKGKELKEYLGNGVLEKYGVVLYASEEAAAAFDGFLEGLLTSLPSIIMSCR
ncbi:MAG: hypothetical protein ACOZF2_16075 [Thermodesulfobacteriota bacterium]